MKISAFFVSFVLFTTIIITPAFFFWLYFFPARVRSKIIRPIVKIWYNFLFIKLLNIDLQQKIQTKELKAPSLILSNHQSFVDIGILMLLYDCGFILKKTLMYTPFGLIAILVGSIPLERNNMESFLKVVKYCKKRLLQGVNICFFPEGTRSKNGELLPFKKGLLAIYYKENTPTLLLVQQGTSKIMPAGAWLPCFGKKVVVLECGYLQPQNYASSKEFSKACHQKMQVGLKEIKKLL